MICQACNGERGSYEPCGEDYGMVWLACNECNGTGEVTTHFDELCLAMRLLADDPRTIFMGQGVGYDGTTMAPTFKGLPADRLIEMPVAEDMQMGMAIGMSLQGFVPVCVFPRWNFLICATNQIVNHLDRLSLYSDYRPKVIIRTAVPSTFPFNPGPQHDDDFTDVFRGMLRTVDVVTLHTEAGVVPAYQAALKSERSTIVVEFTDRYKDQRAHG
jgi:pyruvate/2-oxoglutarate/acetoin dehydrogenase E1 component